MKVFNYIRVSTKSQNETRQLDQHREFNEVNNFTNAIELIDKATGTNMDRANLQLLLKIVGEGDLVVVSSIDRLSRNYKEVIQLWNEITSKGADIVVLDMPLLDTRQYKDLLGDFISNLILQVLGYVAQQETEFRHERQMQGIASMPVVDGKKISKKTNRPTGRPTIEYPDNWEDVYSKWINKEITGVKAYEQLGLKKTTFYKLVKEYKEAQ